MEELNQRLGLGLSAGSRVGASYRLERRIGAGGAGEVWRAFCERLQRPVAIKAIEAARLGQGALREAQVTARLQHPAIVRVYEVLEEVVDGQPLVLLVLELLDGESLADRVAQQGPLDARLAAEIMVPVLDALDYAHAEGVVHRDVKPENLMWLHRAPYGPRLRLLDFGIALAAADWRNVQRMQGTPDYMAPEQVDGSQVLLPAVDQWGAAATIFYLVTGTVPFEASDHVATFQKILTAPLPFPRERPMPGSLFRLIARATRKDPAQRFASMDEFRAALQEFVSESQDSGPGAEPRHSATFRRRTARASNDSQPSGAWRPNDASSSPKSDDSPKTAHSPKSASTTLDEAIRKSIGAGKPGSKS